jgi:hypothetical protein
MPATHPSKTSVRRVRITLWLVPFVVLVLILGALGMGLLVGCGSDQMPSDEVISVLEGRIAALNEGDGKAAAAFYAVNATMEELDQAPLW